MITTIVLIKADPKRIPEAALKLAGIDGVQEVYSVSGEWDLVAIVKVADLPDFLPYYETISPSEYADRIAARQAAVAARMLG